MSVVGISGSLRTSSRTASLVQRILDRVSIQTHAEVEFIDLSISAQKLFAASDRDSLAGEAAEIIRTVEEADALVVGTPVYRGSYTGAFKHLFDLVDRHALVGKPVLLAATAGLAGHALVIEHQLRPLFGFFRALTVPTPVYLVEGDFDGLSVKDPAASARIDRATLELGEFLGLRRSAESRSVDRVALGLAVS